MTTQSREKQPPSLSQFYRESTVILKQKGNPKVFKEKGICAHPDCIEPAVGKAWDTIREDKPNAYCRKHLELAKKLGHPIKLFSDTDVVYDEGAS